ncbi:MAG: N,N'-diacetylchitobiose phosphorylase [Lachnospiraceae bacterium]|nr:N,N'-diacetylchitobiose phosphorylase [Lachnospiraceae bacterium]
MKYGHFDNDKREYVIDRVDLPTSWTNYLGVKDFVTVINHTAGGYSFYQSPEYHRITRFRPNGVPMDRPGHYIYVRDAEDGDYWSLSWQPVGKPLDQAKYTARHGMSYSVFACEYKGIKGSQKLFIPVEDPVEIWDVTLENTGDTPRTLDVFSYLEFSYHMIQSDNQNFQMSLYCAGTSYEDGIIEEDLFYEKGGYQYFTSTFEPDGFDGVRDTFIGLYHTESNPEAVIRGSLSGSQEKGNNHCAALQKKVTLSPGESVRLIYLLGEGNREAGRAMRAKYQDFAAVDQAFDDLHAFWEKKFAALQIQTPNEGMNTLINTWTLYQSEINVMFSRFASFIEVGGRTGLGYRDTAQDAMTIPHSNPEKCRMRIEQLLRGLCKAGYGLHLFQPEWFEEGEKEEDDFVSPTVIPGGNLANVIHGLKDACADDALWLVPSIIQYVKETGDFAFLDKQLPYADTFKPDGCGEKESVYEHMKRILDFSGEQVGDSGICKGLRADWNDCLNLGGGESAMVSFLHVWALREFTELTAYLAGRLHISPEQRAIYEGDTKTYEAMREKVTNRCNEILWDGEWYLRGFTKFGKKIGTHTDEEGRIHLESNAWAVLSGAAGKERAEKTLESIDKYLYTPYGLLLNTPSYTKEDMSIGFITRVYPGLKENGAVFSHPNPWVWAAACRIGRGDLAMKFYDALSPYNQNDMIEIRRSEPYSYCQFISGRDHSTYGWAHHPFMTGSGGWSYFSATEYMLGVRPGFAELIVDPCVPADWKEFSVQRIFRGATYHIHVLNPDHVMKGVKEIRVNGAQTEHIPVLESGREATIEVIMG